MTKQYLGNNNYSYWLDSGKILELSEADVVELTENSEEKVVSLEEKLEELQGEHDEKLEKIGFSVDELETLTLNEELEIPHVLHAIAEIRKEID